MGMKGSQLRELSLLNGMELKDKVSKGTLIKTLGVMGGGVAQPAEEVSRSSPAGNAINNKSGGLKNNNTGTKSKPNSKKGKTTIGSKKTGGLKNGKSLKGGKG